MWVGLVGARKEAVAYHAFIALLPFPAKQSHFEVAYRLKPPFWQRCIDNFITCCYPMGRLTRRFTAWDKSK